MSKRKTAVRKLRDFDDIFFVLTGKRVSTVLGRAVETFGGDIMSRIGGKPPEPPDDPNDPYRILGVRPDASDIVVKAVFRRLAKDTHPDTGAPQSETAFKKYTEAYNRIMAERNAAASKP